MPLTGASMTATASPSAPRDRPLFLLTIDTEEEWDWNGPFPTPPFSTRNIDEIPAFQDFCRELGVRPTYFVDHAVADDEKNAALLERLLPSGANATSAPTCTPGAPHRSRRSSASATPTP